MSANSVISIVTPVYFNEANLPDTIPKLLSLRNDFSRYRLELVFVDDGSGDRSLTVLLDYQREYPDIIKVVKLARNFGSMAAIQAGLAHATGDCIGIIAADLQDPPELFLQMVEYWEKGVKAIFAVRADREESWLQKLFSNFYYWAMRKFAIPCYPSGGFDFFLIDSQISREINNIHEKNTNIMSLTFWLGHEHVLLPYVRRKREKGESRWTMGKKIKLFIDSFVAFSYTPVRAMSTIGLLLAAGAFIYGIFVLISWAFSGIHVKGYAPIVIIISWIGGIQMMMLGILGEYLWRTLDEVRRRPSYVIDKIFD